MRSPPPAEPEATRPQPESPLDLFLSFTWLALQGFGGVLAIVQRELVEKKRWMTPAEFVQEWSVAQVMPGPNVVNLCIMVGRRYFGLRGALAALAGILLAPLGVMLVAALLYAHYAQHPGVAGALRGMGAVAAGMIAATGLKLIDGLHNHPLGRGLCLAFGLACFAAIALLRWPLAWVLPALGLAACLLTYQRLPADNAQR